MALAQVEAPLRATTRALENYDVLRMHKAGVKPGEIITTIWISECHFDTFPPVLQALKMSGVPDSVLKAMTLAPYGPPATASVASPKPAPQTAKVRIPVGTVIEVETASRISTADVDKGARLIFLVSRQVFVDNVLVIARGAVARARVIKSKRSGAWGRGGKLDWIMEDVLAVDGTRVPIQFSGQVKGTNRSAAVVAAAIITGAVVFPYTPPAGLVWALKKGDDAVLYPSQKSSAIVSTNSEVAGVVPEKQKVIYHSADKLKAAEPQRAAGLPAFNNSFRATPIRRP
ncbi:MAG: hypothetical protein H0V18_20885 [Pyrinomonadaceae bacterium]|nr:hypothetical protein [Pyrinomonadaceae bacterium]